MHDIFISYSHADEKAARLIAERLRKEGLSVFFDSQGIVAGSDLTANLNRELESADTVLAVLSVNTAQSRWVTEEVQRALARDKRIIPILLDQHATENWLWPLLGTRQSFKLDLASPDARDQLAGLARAVSRATMVGEASAPPEENRRFRRESLLIEKSTLLIAVTSAAVGAIATWLVQWLLSK